MLYLSYHRLNIALPLLASAWLSAWGCEHRPFPKLCKDYAAGAPGDSAIFIGRAARSFPNTETIHTYFEMVYGSSGAVTPEDFKSRLKNFWRNHLTQDEKDRLDGPLISNEALSPFGREFGQSPVLTSFEVEEVLHGPVATTALEVIHEHPDQGCLGIGFEAGKRYLVEAVRVKGRWYTGTHSQTVTLDQSHEPLFLRLLRRNVDDQLAQKFLFGSLHENGFAKPGVAIRINSKSGYEFETVTLELGQFLFTGLPDEEFELSVSDRRVRRIQGTLDLSHYSCSDVFVMTERKDE